MKRLTVAAALLVPVVAFTVYNARETHRLRQEMHWVFTADEAEFYELDTIYASGETPPPTVGTYSGKVPFEDPLWPFFNDWHPVEEPRTIIRGDLKEFQRALQAFDAQTGHDREHYPLEPRVGLRFSKDGVAIYDVLICIYGRRVRVQSPTGDLVYEGDMHGSFPLFARAVSRMLPHDKRAKALVEGL